jgi:hypothetical protein
MNDAEAYATYKNQRKWFNKLWLAEKLNYYCGPAGIAPNKSGWYIVRPIMNLSGMGVGAKKKYISAGEISVVYPGNFWCEWFEGSQYSVCFEWDKKWKQKSCWRAERDTNNLSKFKKWIRYDHKIFNLPDMFNELHENNITSINVEFIDDNIIEVHLRNSPDPDYDEIIPIWEGEEILIDKYEKIGYSYIINYENADGLLKKPRLGFAVKNISNN